MSFRLLFFLFIAFAAASCVTNRKYQMMQKNDVNVQNQPFDSVMRRYSLDEFEYKVQTNDIINIRFESLTAKEYDFLSVQQTVQSTTVGGALLVGDIVDESGEIPFPVVGKVKVAGLSIFQVQEKLQAIAKQYLDSPIVKARLLNYRATFLGEVNREGVIAINNNRVSVLEAIGLAGGLTDLADKTSVKLIRQNGDSAEVVYLNLQQENFMNSPYYYINQNDVIVVPALKQRPYRKYFGQNLSLIISSISLLLIVLTYTK